MKGNSAITLRELEQEAETLRKRIFIYETLQAEKEVSKKKVKGPFKSGRSLVRHIKTS